MLRIEEDATTAKTVRLRLHGRLAGEWVGILRAVCEKALARELAVVLDLTGVSYADREGVHLLKIYQVRPVMFVNCSPFLKEQLREPVGTASQT